MFCMDGRSDNFDEIEDYLDQQWFESLSLEEQRVELERLRAEFHDKKVVYHLREGLLAALVQFHEAMTEMYVCSTDALNLDASVLALSKLHIAGECDEELASAVSNLRMRAVCGLPQAQRLSSVACVVSAHAALDRLLAGLYGLLVLSQTLAVWFDCVGDRDTGLARQTLAVIKEHARDAIREFTAMNDPKDMLAALTGVLGTEIAVDEDLETAWRAHRRLRDALIGGAAFHLTIDDHGQCTVNGLAESLTGVPADTDLAFSAASVCEAVALVVTEAIERALGIEFIDDETRRVEHESMEESREHWRLGLKA